MKKIFSIFALLVCVISGCSCDKDDDAVRTAISSSYVIAFNSKDSDNYFFADPFGTYIGVTGYDEEDVYDVQDDLNKLTTKYHSLLDRNYYYKYADGTIMNNIRVINDSYGSGQAIEVDDIIIEVLKEGIKYTKLSNGKFNILAGSIVDVWDVRFNILASSYYGIDPTEDQINEGLACVPSVSEIDSVLVIDEDNNTVTFNSFSGCDSGASITLGALAKSYFLDKLNADEEISDLDDYILDAGQSSIIVNGYNPTRERGLYNIAVLNSYTSDKRDYAVQLQLKGKNAISTSSGDQKGYVKQDGTRRHHIIDATSGYPNNYLLATTVITDSAMIADIITTTLMTMESLEEIKTYLTLLQSNQIEVKVLLEVNVNDSLVIYANSEMKKVIGKVFDGVTVEEFSYGAQA